MTTPTQYSFFAHPKFMKETHDKMSEEEQDELYFVLTKINIDGITKDIKKLRNSKQKLYELKFSVRGQVWRIAFVFDAERRVILLVGGSKQGKNQKRFYEALIVKGDARAVEVKQMEREVWLSRLTK